MMHVTFLDHSGFLVELPGLTLLFDWWQGDLPPLPSDPLLVFASHRHPDHFNPRIFALDDGQRDVRFLLGKGIHLTDRNRKKWGLSEKAAADCRVLSGGESASPLPGVTVEALPSTDEGVAFLVTAEGRTVFHAGDLNWWHWEGEDPVWNRSGAGRSIWPCCLWILVWGRTASVAPGTSWSWRISAAFCPCTSGEILTLQINSCHAILLSHPELCTLTESVKSLHLRRKRTHEDRWQ